MANAYLTRTPSSNATSRFTFTASMWLKRSGLGEEVFWGSYSNSNYRFQLFFNSTDNLCVLNKDNSVQTIFLQTNRKFSDTNGWYHIYIAVKSSETTASDRVKIYVNGVRETSFSSATYQSTSNDQAIGTSSYPFYIGKYGGTGGEFNGSMSHSYYVDGSIIDVTQFGSTDSTTGEWKINTSPTIASYGNQGHLILKDGNTITDQSTNSNNFSLGGGTLTNTEDNPSNVFATWNPLIGRHTDGTNLVPTLSNGNTTSFSDGSTWQVGLSTLAASSGKYYTEVKWISDSNTRYSEIGLYEVDAFAQKITGYPYMPDMANCYGLRDSDGKIRTGGSATSYGVSYGPSNIISVAMDLDNNKLYYAKDGVWMNSANPSSGTGGFSIIANKTYAFGLQQYAVGNITFSTNFGNGYFGTTAVASAGTNASGNGIFEYDVPTNYTALSTKGLNL